MYWIVKVNYLFDYYLKIEFNDGTLKTVDLSNVVGGTGIFAPLKDIEYFKKVSIDECGNTICWENGADIAPEFLYEIGE